MSLDPNFLELDSPRTPTATAIVPATSSPSLAVVKPAPRYPVPIVFPVPSLFNLSGVALEGSSGGVLRDAYRHIRAEARSDILVNPTSCVMKRGRLHIPGGRSFTIEAEAVPAIFGQVNTALAGAGRTALSAIQTQRFDAFDALFSAVVLGRNDGKTVRLGTRQLPGRTERTAYRLVSKTYGHTIDALAVLSAIGRACAQRGDIKRAEVAYTGYRLTCDVYADVKRPVYGTLSNLTKVGQEIEMGVRLTTADDASEALHAFVRAWRLVCLNGMTVPNNRLAAPKIVHRGNGSRLVSAVNNAISKAFGLAGQFMTTWHDDEQGEVARLAHNAKVKAEGKGTRRDAVFSAVELGTMTPKQGFEALVAQGFVKVPSIKPKALVEALVTAWKAEALGYNRTALVNAVTRAAHEANFGPAAQTMLEEQGTNLLYARIALAH